ncbi:sigma-70 family RNA polymerase sigma factor [Actinocrinis puniceicyclus]|uniref:Sigma-70 family RNA polymerase sigma factor n=1 Tax=Actinocrinis puniceicyclus TaxID=977794 RepID=A0A8J8BAK8_9ACTN|nr:sigma-70 family RNA polymerase sigma factor [Actinocrinis puniceicyclus]
MPSRLRRGGRVTTRIDTLSRASGQVGAGKGGTVDEDSGTQELLAAASRGDQKAWDLLVNRFTRLVWSVARSFRLSDADAADVCQTTWLRLVEHLDAINDPDRLAGWLATTARRESIGVLRRRDREVPIFEAPDDEDEDDDQDPERRTIEQDEHRELWDAFAALSERCRSLLRVLAVSPLESYAQVAAALRIPVGSIGPTRARCLERLRARLAT